MKPNFYVVGEVWHSAQSWLDQAEFDGVMNYPFTDAIIDGIILNKINITNMMDALINNLMKYRDQNNQVMLNSLDTHDTARILTLAKGDKNKVRQALAFMFMLTGSPCIYYGDEVGVEGDTDPDNRRFFPWGQEKSSRIIQEVKKLVDRRKKNILLQEGRLGFVIARGSHCPALAIVRYDDQGNSVYNWLNLTQYKQIISPENCEYLCLPQNIQQKFQHELTLDSWEYKVI